MATFRKIETREVGDITIVTFREPRFAETAEIQALGVELYALADDKARRKLVLDFYGVDYLSSAAFGKLISMNMRVQKHSGMLILCNIEPDVLAVFQICKLNEVFDIRKTENDALSAFCTP